MSNYFIDPEAYVISCTGWGRELRFTNDGAKECAGNLEIHTGKVASIEALYSKPSVQRLIDIETAARRLAYIVRKSTNAGPISNDPTAEGHAWRTLREALGEEYDEKGNLK